MNTNSLFLAMLKIIKQKIWYILLFALLFISIGAVYTYAITDDKYESSVTLLITPNTQDNTTNSTLDILLLIDTITDLTKSEIVLTHIANLNGYSTDDEVNKFIKNIMDKIIISSSNQSFIIKIAVTDTDKNNSMEYANEIADALIMEYKHNSSLDWALFGDIEIISRAQPGYYVSPNKSLYMTIFAIAGLLVGGLTVWLYTLFDNKFLSTLDIVQNCDIAVIGELSYDKKSPDLLNKKSNDKYFATFDKIITNLKYVYAVNKSKIIMTASTIKGELKSSSIAGLALAMNRLEYKVLIIDLDLRMSSIHKLFMVGRNNGITDYAVENIEADSIIKHTPSGVDIITSGSHAPAYTTAKILESSKLDDMINKLKDKYDYILVDTPPLLPCKDALIISKKCEGIVFNVGLNCARKTDFKSVIDDLRLANPNILGICVTKIK